MNLNDLKPEMQRLVLVRLSARLKEIAEYAPSEEIEDHLIFLQDGYLDALEAEHGDFFGTEGWQHWLGLE